MFITLLAHMFTGSPNSQACNIGIVEGPLATVAREDERVSKPTLWDRDGYKYHKSGINSEHY